MWLLLQSHLLLHQDSRTLETIGSHPSPLRIFRPAGRNLEHHTSRKTCGFLSEGSGEGKKAMDEKRKEKGKTRKEEKRREKKRKKRKEKKKKRKKRRKRKKRKEKKTGKGPYYSGTGNVRNHSARGPIIPTRIPEARHSQKKLSAFANLFKCCAYDPESTQQDGEARMQSR